VVGGWCGAGRRLRGASSTSLAEDEPTRQQDQPEHLPEEQVEQPQRHVGIMSDRRSPLVSNPAPTSGTPHGSCPDEEDVARGLHHPLPLHHPLAGLLVAALRQVILQRRGGGLLDLQAQGVLRVASLEQDDERAGCRRCPRSRPYGPCPRSGNAPAGAADRPAARPGRRAVAHGANG
jgi:hypothetical protein